MTGGAEAFDLADLGDHQHRGVGADPAQLAEHLDAGVVAGERVDLTLRQLDLAIEVADQAEQTFETPACRLAQRQLGEERLSSFAEQIGVLVLDPLASEQGVHAVLQRRAHPRQHDPVAEQVTQVTQLAWRDIGLRQEIAAQQMRERARVDRVGLDACRRDRLGS